jgi:hypothetical protein
MPSYRIAGCLDPAGSRPRTAIVFRALEDPRYPCIRIPSIVRAGREVLLAFAEARYFAGDGCHPRGLPPRAPLRYKTASGRTEVGSPLSYDKDIVMKRSEDGGRNWSALHVVVPHAAQPTAVGRESADGCARVQPHAAGGPQQGSLRPDTHRRRVFFGAKTSLAD